MSLDFEKYAVKGNEFVHKVAEDLDISPVQAGRIIRAVFHAFRNRLTDVESFQLLAQLPMALKGVYVEGWKFSKDYNRINRTVDFLDEVRKEDDRLAGYDFGDNVKAGKAVASVFKALNYLISEGEMNDIMAVVPTAIKGLIRESIAGKEKVF